MKIIDCFTLFNEIDLLRFRLELLNDIVDLFVISEANLTHSGKEKSYNFLDNKDKFKKWEDKIIYFPVELATDGLHFNEVTKYDPTDGSWILENEQRNGLYYCHDKVSPEDYVLVGDLDEMPNPEILKALKEGGFKPTYPKSLIQPFHYFWMNYRMRGRDEFWKGTVLIPGNEFLNSTPQHFRDNRNFYDAISYGGWHFSYLGGVDKIKTKIESFAHTEFNRDEYKSDENIKKALDEGQDLFKRNDIRFERIDINARHYSQEYPTELCNLIRKYPNFLKQ